MRAALSRILTSESMSRPDPGEDGDEDESPVISYLLSMAQENQIILIVHDEEWDNNMVTKPSLPFGQFVLDPDPHASRLKLYMN